MQTLLHNLCTVGVFAFLLLVLVVASLFLMSVFGPPVVDQF